jgi:hypothetical protein
MDVLERVLTTLFDALPRDVIQLAYEAMALGLHVAAAVVFASMLVTALAMALLVQCRDQLVGLAADQLAAGREEHPARVGPELGGVVGGPRERRPAMLDLRRDDEDDGRDTDAQLGALGLAPGREHDHGWGAGGRRGWPQDADRHAAAQAQVGALR